MAEKDGSQHNPKDPNRKKPSNRKQPSKREQAGTKPGGTKDPQDSNSREDSRSGFIDRVLRPWKKQRVTMTRPGAKRASMRRGRTKPPAKPEEEKAKGPSPSSKRAVKELKTLLEIGKRDPERLAGIISRMLREDEEKQTQERLKFERLVWRKADGKKPEDGEE